MAEIDLLQKMMLFLFGLLFFIIGLEQGRIPGLINGPGFIGISATCSHAFQGKF